VKVIQQKFDLMALTQRHYLVIARSHNHSKLLADSGSVPPLCGGGQGEGLYMEMKSLFLTRWAVLIPNKKRIIDRIFFCNLAKFKITTTKCF
jgi:hypothetical protein